MIEVLNPKMLAHFVATNKKLNCTSLDERCLYIQSIPQWGRQVLGGRDSRIL